MKIPLQNDEERLSRRERERARHRREIMEAAIRVFALRGYAQATLDEVSQEAEFSKGALYLYFSSKEDILFNILFDMSRDIIRFFRETLCGKRSFREELQDLFLKTAEYSFVDRDRLILLMGQHVAGFTAVSAEGREKLMEMHKKFVDTLRERTKKAHEDGEIRDLPLEAISSMVHGSLDGMATTRWYLSTVEEATMAVRVYIEILFQGIATERKNFA